MFYFSEPSPDPNNPRRPHTWFRIIQSRREPPLVIVNGEKIGSVVAESFVMDFLTPTKADKLASAYNLKLGAL